MRKRIQEIDEEIFSEIIDTNNTFKTAFNPQFYDIFRNKRKDRKILELINANILQDISSGKYDDAYIKLYFYTFYVNMIENIPTTNQRALDLVHCYFFKDTESDKCKQDLECSVNLTYISLMIDAKGIIPIDKVYYNEAFTFIKDSTDAVNEKILNRLDNHIDKINTLLIKLPEFKNTSILFGFYILVQLILCIVLIYVYSDVMKDEIPYVAEYVRKFLESILAGYEKTAGSKLGFFERMTSC